MEDLSVNTHVLVQLWNPRVSARVAVSVPFLLARFFHHDVAERAMSESRLVRAARTAIQAAEKRNTFLARISDRFALPQLIHKYSKNLLTHGEEFLRGDDELPLFAPGVWHAPLKWRPIPGPGAASLSRATLSTTETGTALLRGMYGGSRGEFTLLAGKADLEASPVGAGACGVASIGHWGLDFAQHHWLEVRVRTGARAFELVLQSDGQFEGSARLWRANIPEAPDAGRAGAAQAGTDDGAGDGDGRSGGGVGRGAYGVLDVAPDASDEEIRRSYRELVLELHPDRGGDEERFKAVSRAYALLGDPERRAHYDEFGVDEDDADDDAGLDDLGPWRTIKVPFTAFRDRTFFKHHENIDVVYVLLAGEVPGPFALEVGEIKAGRCEKAHLDGAGFFGHDSCEQGHCECGYYNGLRAEAFEGPLKLEANGRIRPGALEWGHAEHHLRDGEAADW